MKRKRFLAAILVLVMVLSPLTFTASATDEEYSYSLDCTLSGSTVTAVLSVSGGKVQGGTFGIGYNKEILTFGSFSYSVPNVTSFISMLDQYEKDSSIFGNDTENGKYVDRWMIENTAGAIYVDATSAPVEIGRFTFTVNESQTFAATSLFKAESTETPKAYVGENYIVTPYSTDLSVTHSSAPITVVYTPPVTKTVTFKINATDTENYAISSGYVGTNITFPTTIPEKTNYEFKYWSADGIARYVGTTIPSEDITLTAVFEYVGILPHKYFIECRASGENVSATLYYKGGNIQSGTFGIDYDTTALTLVSFTPARSEITLTGSSTGFYGNTAGRYFDRWIIEDQTGDICLDGTTERKAVGTFSFTLTEGKTFAASMIEAADCTATDKAYVDGYFVVSPYSNDVTVTHEKVEVVSITLAEILPVVEVNVSIATSNDNDSAEEKHIVIADEQNPTEILYDSRAKITIYDEDNNLVTTFIEDNTSGATSQFNGSLESGKTYRVEIEKNGYLKRTQTIEVDGTQNEIVIDNSLVAGDIKGSMESYSGDGEIDISDFIRLIRGFDTNASTLYKSVVDINESGAVTIEDLVLIKANFGKSAND